MRDLLKPVALPFNRSDWENLGLRILAADEEPILRGKVLPALHAALDELERQAPGRFPPRNENGWMFHEEGGSDA